MKMQMDKGKLLSLIVINPKEDVKVLMLRSGRKLKNKIPKHLTTQEEQSGIKIENSKQPKINSNETQHAKRKLPPLWKDFSKEETRRNINKQETNKIVLLPSFLSRLANKKKEHGDNILDIFKKVEVNVSLLNVIKQIPRYVKFLKEICTFKIKL